MGHIVYVDARDAYKAFLAGEAQPNRKQGRLAPNGAPACAFERSASPMSDGPDTMPAARHSLGLLVEWPLLRIHVKQGLRPKTVPAHRADLATVEVGVLVGYL